MTNGTTLKLRHFVDLSKKDADEKEALYQRKGFTVSKAKQSSGEWSVAATKCS